MNNLPNFIINNTSHLSPYYVLEMRALSFAMTEHVRRIQGKKRLVKPQAERKLQEILKTQ